MWVSIATPWNPWATVIFPFQNERAWKASWINSTVLLCFEEPKGNRMLPYESFQNCSVTGRTPASNPAGLREKGGGQQRNEERAKKLNSLRGAMMGTFL